MSDPKLRKGLPCLDKAHLGLNETHLGHILVGFKNPGWNLTETKPHSLHTWLFFFFLKCIFYLLPPFKVFTNRHTNDRKQMHPTHHTNYPMHQFNTRLKCKQAVVNPIKLSEQGVNNQWTFTVNVYYVQLENNYESESALEPRLRLMSQLKEAFRVNCVNWHACIHTCVPPSGGATWFLRL